MRAQRKRPEVWISGAALLALGALFVLWWRATPGVTAPGRIAALLSAALFAAVGLRFVPRWMDFWRDAPERQPTGKEMREFRCAVRTELNHGIPSLTMIEKTGRLKEKGGNDG